MIRGKRMGLLASALVLGTGAAAVEAKFAPLLEELRAQGYGRIELDREGDQIRIEAALDGAAREVVFDVGTGLVISDKIRGA